jgi:urease accessory protein
MISGKRLTQIAAVAAPAALSATPAFAHHVMGGGLPSTFAQGFLSGIGHPIIGVDHFLFIVGVGLLAAMIGRPLLLPLGFILGTLAGVGLHVQGLNLPFGELAIALSVVLMAVAVIAEVKLSAIMVGALVAVAGIFHGYAYGESIYGAEPTPLVSYMAGFALIQLAIACGTAWGFSLLRDKRGLLADSTARVLGGAMAGVAAFMISNIAFGL